ncbi:MAG: GAF domain-containing protein, partial [Planctomycetota bacterium]|nr:GAF domain-containing protein [Planctomycetota bacterium]
MSRQRLNKNAISAHRANCRQNKPSEGSKRHIALEELLAAERDLGLALASASSLHEALQACLRTAISISGMDSGGIYLVADDGSLSLAYEEGLSPSFLRGVRSYGPDSKHAQWVKEGRPAYITISAPVFPFNDLCQQEGLLSLAAIPVFAGGKIVACLNVASHTQAEIAPAVRTALEDIAARIGTAIIHARAEESLRESEALYACLLYTS